MKAGKIIAIELLVLALGTGGFADVFELPLNCTGTYDVNTPLWTTDFDLGVTFSEISHVYIDWSGTITAEVAYWSQSPDDTFPLDGRFSIALYKSDPTDSFGYAYIQKGADTYPAPESFDLETVIACVGDDWTALLDGQGSVRIGFYQVPHYGNVYTLVYPRGQLNSATLIFEGAVIPEPASLLLLGTGFLGLIAKRRQK